MTAPTLVRRKKKPMVALPSDPQWYKDAVIYQLHVKAYYDSNGDGIGDFPGLTSRLDYIQDLGVNTIWLQPFYPSPMRDDGYDIADYHNVYPDYGTRKDFSAFVRAAHRRGIRVITELVINHTSDQHPWFQAARRAPAGSAKRDYYVWSDTDQKFPETRIIFTDTETSNWAWDPVAKAYYWHRFFSHQPDLNHNNPSVVKAVIRLMRFWLDLGVDGLRLDAIPYLCVREGTTNENLPETHAVIRQMRAVVDAHYKDRLFLAEANQWPEDVRDYFGDGDECHMAYHFPLMPRMYMAVAQEDRYPMTEILAQTPEIPPSCQWAIFLRNHDELTLEMVTHRERDYMYEMYAADPRMRVNVGIRRRLAPLMDNDLDRIKLLNSLLLSMPGSPIVYYGDEIGMGDNFYLGDRNGMRTPMQWTPDRNAGFSRADPQRLYLPPIMDPIYGFQAVNVEAQGREPSSLLNWMKRLIAVRKAHKGFGRGTFTMLHPGNRKIVAYVRQHEGEVILCAANLARSAQPVELDLCRWRGLVPLELIGGTPFPPIGDLPYLLTLPGHAFYWFRLAPEADAPDWHQLRMPPTELPVMVLTAGLATFFPERIGAARAHLAEGLRRQLERDVLLRFFASQRWFAGRESAVEAVRILGMSEWSTRTGTWLLTIVSVDLHDQPPERYVLSIALAWEGKDGELPSGLAAVTLARVRQRARTGILYSAFADDAFCRAALTAMGQGSRVTIGSDTLTFSATSAYPGLVAELPPDPELRRLTEAASSGVVFGERLFLKGSRRLRAEVDLALEMGRFLTERAPEVRTVPIGGAIEVQGADGELAVLAILQGYVENQGDAWSYTQGYLERFLTNALAVSPHEDPAGAGSHAGFALLMSTLGRRTAELHAALAPADPGAVPLEPAFAPEPIAPDEPAQWVAALGEAFEAMIRRLRQDLGALPAGALAVAGALLDRADHLPERLAPLGAPVAAAKSRRHGDFHLGQVLIVGADVMLIGFGAEPGDLARRAKESPLRDLARLLFSLHCAAATALEKVTAERTGDLPVLEPLARDWESVASAAFMAGYREHIVGCPTWPPAPGEAERLIALFALRRACQEVYTALTDRPEAVAIPLGGLLALLNTLT
ncbi:maltose alpha-D-glucosyltransferase [uncultured Thiodictyon sp.]|uniref:maltose alpha-D-glucosyltransferase n=1 Tax=uncultured Thiodictyon sp. TaxID=1846217 RepID=UPI0025F9C487|nr:maltose alpha-D-glucosyltransferase [uncultured Thiodictyon sp.]